MANFNMSRLRRLITGEYVDLAGNIITKNRRLTPEARAYLQSRYGKEHADRVNWNTRNGNVYLNGKWRADDPSTGQRTLDWNTAVRHNGYKKTFEDWETGKTTYFNKSDKDADMAKRGRKSTPAKQDVKEDPKTSTSKLKKLKSEYFEEAVKLNPTFVIREINKDRQKGGKDLDLLKKLFYKDENGIIYYKSSVDNKPHYINDNTTIDGLNGYTYKDLYRVNRMVNSPYIKLQGLPVEGTKWLWNEAIVPGASWLWNKALVPGAEWTWDDVIVPGSKGAYSGGKWFFGLDRKGGKLEKFKKGGNMLQKFSKGGKKKNSKVKVSGQTPTASWKNTYGVQETMDANGNPIYQLNKRGRMGTLDWNMGRQSAINKGNLLTTLGLNDLATTQQILLAMRNYAKEHKIAMDHINDDNFADGRWGTLTQSAWDALNHYIALPKNPATTNVAQVSNPYTRSAWDYSRGIDNLGFNNYQGLVNFVQGNANHGFARDLVNRFGAVDTWKLADIENALGIRGRYGRGFLGSGDYTDMLKSMAKWAGENDANYDRYWNGRNSTTSQSTPSSNNSFLESFSPAYAAELGIKHPGRATWREVIEHSLANNTVNADWFRDNLLSRFPQRAKRGMKLPPRNVVSRFKTDKNYYGNI